MKKQIILLFPLILPIVYSIITNNRSLLLGVITSIVIIVYLLTKNTKLLYIPIISLLILFFIKLDSSLGRILIYKISYPILKENWLIGIGFGNTKFIYPYYQERYFRNNVSEKEILLADNTFYVFNEYYTLILEFGIIVIPFIIILLYKIKNQIIRLLNLAPTTFNFTLSSTIITFLVYSAFNFTVSEYPVLWFPFISLLILLFFDKINKSLILIISLLLINIGVYISYYFEQKHINNLYSYFKADIDVKEFLKDEEPFFHQSRRQYYNILSELSSKEEKWEEAKSNTLRLIQLYPSDAYITRLGLILEKSGNFGLAEYYLIRSTWFVPNRLSSHYELFKFYLRNNDLKKAKAESEIINKFKVKIPSDYSNFIIFDVNQKINKL